MDDQDRPTLAFFLCFLAAVLIIADGWFIAAIGSAVTDLGSYAAGSVIGAVGAFGVFLGVILLVLAVALYVRPEYHTGVGIATIILSLVSILGGGGFIVGVILGVIGGILAIYFVESDDDEPFPMESASRWRSLCANCAKPLTPGSLTCSFCGTPVRPDSAI
ncbi:MAG: DUF6114 domain-containing protein [Thermoplasmata archaeon]|nr:DUF6114 domain-containing protein [Thermoplasmata archaeon]